MPVKEGRVSQLSSSGTQHQTEASFVVGSEGDLALPQCFSVFLPSCTASSALHLPSDSFQLPHKLLLLQERTLRFYLKNPKVPDWLLLARANLETFNSQSQTLHGSLSSYVITMQFLGSSLRRFFSRRRNGPLLSPVHWRVCLHKLQHLSYEEQS